MGTSSASYGAVLIPGETGDVTEAMQLVDQRMYARKAAGRRSADRQTKGVLLTALYERHPELSTRFRAVADLADAVSERMGMPVEQRATGRQAAELHDIGKGRDSGRDPRQGLSAECRGVGVRPPALVDR